MLTEQELSAITKAAEQATPAARAMIRRLTDAARVANAAVRLDRDRRDTRMAKREGGCVFLLGRSRLEFDRALRQYTRA